MSKQSLVACAPRRSGFWGMVGDTRVARPLRSMRRSPILSHSLGLDFRQLSWFPPFRWFPAPPLAHRCAARGLVSHRLPPAPASNSRPSVLLPTRFFGSPASS